MPTILSASTEVKTGISGHFARLKYKQQLLAIFSLLLVCVMFWIAITLFSSQQKVAISPDLLKMSQSLNPSVQIQLLDSLQTKKIYTDSELQRFPIYIIEYDQRTQIGKIVRADEAGVTE